ncbi:MAG: phosphohistidine phosphatase SixA [Cyanobacteria bacterium P01_A01_bin.123]
MALSIPTELYLIRHGIAAERGTYDNDCDRPLTAKGDVKTHQIAERLKALGLNFETLLTSPLVRARQTADILSAVGLSAAVDVCDHLAPNGNFAAWLTWLASWQQTGQSRLALIGHEPDLSRWAQILVEGQISDRWVLKKAGVIGLQVPEARQARGQSQLVWLSPPRFLLSPHQ